MGKKKPLPPSTWANVSTSLWTALPDLGVSSAVASSLGYTETRAVKLASPISPNSTAMSSKNRPDATLVTPQAAYTVIDPMAKRTAYPADWVLELHIPDLPGAKSGSELARSFQLCTMYARKTKVICFSLPKYLRKMCHVHEIADREMGLTHIPPRIAAHVYLRVLDLSGNLIEALY